MSLVSYSGNNRVTASRIAGTAALVNGARAVYNAYRALNSNANKSVTSHQSNRVKRQRSKSRQTQRIKRRKAPGRRKQLHSGGTYQGRVRRPKRFRKNKANYSLKAFLTRGAVLKSQYSFEATGVDNVYVGHGLSWKRYLEVMFQALCIKIFRKANIKIRSVADSIQGDSATIVPTDVAGKFRIFYKQSTAATAHEDIALAAGTTPYTASVALFDWLLNKNNTFLNANLTFKTLEFFKNESTTPAIYGQFCTSSLDLENSMVDCFFSSHLMTQNRSAASGTGDESSMLDVAANPLVGRLYRARGNGFQPRAQNYSGAGTNFLVSNTTGSIVATVTAAAGSHDNVFLKPPVGSAWANCSHSRGVMFQPGAIRKTSLTYKRSMTFSQFIKLFEDFIEEVDVASISSVRIFNSRMGASLMLGLEKMVKAGTEPEISLGCELNDEYRCIIRERKATLLPHVVVT